MHGVCHSLHMKGVTRARSARTKVQNRFDFSEETVNVVSRCLPHVVLKFTRVAFDFNFLDAAGIELFKLLAKNYLGLSPHTTFKVG